MTIQVYWGWSPIVKYLKELRQKTKYVQPNYTHLHKIYGDMTTTQPVNVCQRIIIGTQ